MLDIYHHFQQQLMSIMMGKLENDKEGSPFVNSEPFIKFRDPELRESIFEL